MKKKMKRLKNWSLLVLLVLLLANLISLKSWATGDGDTPQSGTSKVPPNVKVGWRVGSERYIVNYRMEHFGWIGAEFSKFIPVYQFHDCCRYTGNKMDGCSAPVNCKI